MVPKAQAGFGTDVMVGGVASRETAGPEDFAGALGPGLCARRPPGSAVHIGGLVLAVRGIVVL